MVSMSSVLDALPSTTSAESIVSILEHTEQTRLMILSGLTVLLYDHILTLHDEIKLIWNARPGFVSFIFLFNRYVVPALLAVDIYENFHMTLKNALLFCKIWIIVQGYLTILSFMSIHAIVALRVYALHGGRPWIKKLLWVAGILYAGLCLALSTAAQIPAVSPWPSELRVAYDQCVGPIPSWLWAMWLPSVVFETLLFALTMMAALSQTHDGMGFEPLYMILYRDGILYFLSVSLCSVFSLVVWLTAPPSLVGLARYFSLALVNVVGSRMVLNLKSYAALRAKGKAFSYSDTINSTSSGTVLCPLPRPLPPPHALPVDVETLRPPPKPQRFQEVPCSRSYSPCFGTALPNYAYDRDLQNMHDMPGSPAPSSFLHPFHLERPGVRSRSHSRDSRLRRAMSPALSELMVFGNGNRNPRSPLHSRAASPTPSAIIQEMRIFGNSRSRSHSRDSRFRRAVSPAPSSVVQEIIYGIAS